MSLVALDGTPLVIIGANIPSGASALPSSSSITMDAANESCVQYGHVFWEDGGTHTVDTTGSSSLGWRAGTVTFANAGSTFKIGLATVDAATGPPARATNVADVITLSVSKTHTGGGGTVTTGAWNENVPTAGSLSIAHGDFIAFCGQMTARAGVDTIDMNFNAVTGPPRPGVTGFTGGAYGAGGGVPNVVITASDGTLGFFYGGSVWLTSTTTQTWNSGSATKEYGNYFLMPVPAKIYGFVVACTFAGDTDLILYSDPLGTPAAQKTVSVDLNQVQLSAARWSVVLFSSPYSTTASQPVAGIIKPTSVTNTAAPYKTFSVSAHQKSETLGTNCYAVSRASGAFAAVNSNKDRFALGLLVGAFDDGAGGSGPAGKLISFQRGSPY
jgi:hypothetical protein